MLNLNDVVNIIKKRYIRFMKNEKEYIKVKAKTWFLEFHGVLPRAENHTQYEHWKHPDIEEYLKLYHAVGDLWGWTGRLLLSEKELSEKLHSDLTEIWLFKINEKVLGFFEIDFSIPDKAEIVYLGLIPSEIGKGLGKSLLYAAIASAGRNGAQVWLHTCEFDHPNALNSYIQSGFKISNEAIEFEYYPIGFQVDKG